MQLAIVGVVQDIQERQAGAKPLWSLVIRTSRQDAKAETFAAVDTWRPLSCSRGDLIVAACDYRCREYQGKYYSSLVAEYIGVVADAKPQQATPPRQQPQQQPTQPPAAPDTVQDQIPF
jgi:hypothetical protein